MLIFVVNQDLSRFYAPNSDFYSEIQELTQILLRISEEKIGGWGLCVGVETCISVNHMDKIGDTVREIFTENRLGRWYVIIALNMSRKLFSDP